MCIEIRDPKTRVIFAFASLVSGLRPARLPAFPIRREPASRLSVGVFLACLTAAVSEIGNKLRIRYEFVSSSFDS